MAGGARDADDGSLISEINVTPLVDVVLVLLIIMMVTATAIVAKTIPLDLPKADTGEQTSATLALSIDAKGNLFLDREPITEDLLRTRIRKAKQENKDLRAVIAADGKLEHSKVVRAMNLLRQEEVTKFAINVRPDDLAPSTP